MERLMLLDGNGLIYRGYFALPPLTTSKGELVNAVFGFCEHRAARHPGHPARLRSRGLRSARTDLPPRAIRRLQGDAHPDAGRPARPVPEGARGRQGASRLPVYELRRLRGGRRHRDPHGRSPRRSGLDTTIVTGDLDMLQLVSDRVRLMTTRSGVENTIMYDPREDRRALRPAAGPDDRLQGPQGRCHRQHPGRTRGRREDGGEADSRIRRPRRGVRPARRGQARQAARQAVRVPRPGRVGQGAFDDHPGPAGEARPRCRPTRRLRSRRGHPPVPRVRVPEPPGSTAAAARRIGDRRGGCAASRKRDRSRRPESAPSARADGGVADRFAVHLCQRLRHPVPGSSCRSTSTSPTGADPGRRIPTRRARDRTLRRSGHGAGRHDRGPEPDRGPRGGDPRGTRAVDRRPADDRRVAPQGRSAPACRLDRWRWPSRARMVASWLPRARMAIACARCSRRPGSRSSPTR